MSSSTVLGVRQDREGPGSGRWRRAGPVRKTHRCLCHLTGCIQPVPPARVADILAEMFNARVSHTALLAIIRRTAGKFRDPMNSIRETLLKAALKHLDETGLRVASKLHRVA